MPHKDCNMRCSWHAWLVFDLPDDILANIPLGNMVRRGVDEKAFPDCL